MPSIYVVDRKGFVVKVVRGWHMALTDGERSLSGSEEDVERTLNLLLAN